MEDPEVVAAILAGDPAGLAEAYGRYAVPLYSYCRSMLREPADAADAVQDTFLIASAKLRGLRDPGKLRSWLYAVARNECLRRLRVAGTPSALDEVADMPSQTGDIGAAAERAELRELVRSAIGGLNPGERDVIELSLDLEGDDLADALGVSRNHAHALLSRARNQLERSLGALIVARTGRAACAGLDAMLAGWDGQLTVLMRKRISRHIAQCPACGECKRRELTPAMFAGALPLVALPTLALSPGFRAQVLRVMADRSPAGLAHRMNVANRAGPFGPNGFPRPVSPPGAARAAAWHRVLHHPHAVVGSAVVVAAAAITAGIVAGPHHAPPPAGAAGRHGAAAGPVSPSSSHGRPGPKGTRLAPAARGGTAAPAAYRSTRPASPSASGRPTATSAGAGQLAVSTGRLDLVSVNGTATGTFTLTAEGGPVRGYSITVGSTLVGDITVSPATGSLAAGASVTITVTATRPLALDGQLTVNPGGQTITVALSLGL